MKISLISFFVASISFHHQAVAQNTNLFPNKEEGGSIYDGSHRFSNRNKLGSDEFIASPDKEKLEAAKSIASPDLVGNGYTPDNEEEGRIYGGLRGSPKRTENTLGVETGSIASPDKEKLEAAKSVGSPDLADRGYSRSGIVGADEVKQEDTPALTSPQPDTEEITTFLNALLDYIRTVAHNMYGYHGDTSK